MPINIGTIEGLIRLRDEFSARLTKAASELEKHSKRIDQLGKKFTSAGSSLTKSLTLPIVALGAASIKTATDFESSFAGIVKTVSDATDQFGNLTARGQELSDGMRNLSRTIPVNVNELNKIGESAGQLGIKSENILTFTRTMADLGVTTNLSSDRAATALARLANITKLPQTEFDRLGSTIVALGNNFATTEAEIVEMGLRVAGAGTQIGLTEGQILAIATALSSVGIEAEAGGSAISKVMVNIALAVAKGGKELDNFAKVSGLSVAEFKRLFEEDAAAALNAFITGLGNAGEQSLVILDAMGISEVRMRDALLRAAGAGDILTRALSLQSKAWSENTALTKEAEQRYKTFQSQITIFWNRIKDISITLGQALIPMMQDLLNVMEPLIRKAADLAESFSEQPKWFKLTTVSIVGLVAAIGPALFMFGKLLQTWATLITMAPRVAAAIRLVWAALLGPLGVALAAIAAIGIGIDRAINKFKKLADEAIALNVLLANLEGSANRFQRTIQQTGGRVSTSIIVQAREDAKQLAIELDKAKKRFDDLASTLPKGLAKRVKEDPGALDSVGVRTTFGVNQNTIKELREQRDEIGRINEAYEKQKRALRDIKSENVLPDITSDLEGIVDAGEIAGGGIDIVSDAVEGLLKQLAQLRVSLALQLKQQKEVTALIKSTPYRDQESALARLSIAHQVQTKVLEYENQFAELGAAAARDLARALGEQERQILLTTLEGEEYTRFLAALDDMLDIVKTSIDQGINKSLERSKAKFDEASKPLLNFIRELRNLKESTEFDIRVSGIDEVDPRLRQIEVSYLEFLRSVGEGSVRKGEEVVQQWQDTFLESVDEIKAHIARSLDIREAAQFQGASATSSDIFHSQRESIKRLMRTFDEETGKALLSIEDGTAALRAVNRQHLDQQLSDWGAFFGSLSDQFGGLFNYIDSLIQDIQRAQQTGSSLTGAAAGLGMSSGAASSLGTFATVILIWKEIYDIGMGILRDNKLKKFGQAGTVTTSGGEFRTGQSAGVGQVSTEAIRAIQDVIRAFEESLRISIDDLAEIGIKLRNDGKKIKAYVAGVFVGEFNDVMEAIQAALAKALTSGTATFSDMPALMQEGLANLSRGKGIDEILEFLSALREVVDLGLSPAVIAAREFTKHIDTLWKSIEKVGKLTPAVAQAFDNLSSTELSMWQDLFDSITGRQKSAAEIRAEKERELALAKAELVLRKTGIALRKVEIEAFIASIKAGRTLVGGGAGGGAGGGGGSGGIIGVAKAFSTAGQALTQTGQAALHAAAAIVGSSVAMSEGALAMIAALEAEWAALTALQSLLDNLIIPDIGDIRIPGGGGRGAGDRQGVRDFIDDKTFELSMRGLSDYLRALAELDRQYDDLLEQAGKDLELRAKLLDLKAKELAILAKEAKESLADRFQQFLGLVNPFDALRKSAADLIKEIEESPFGDERKARMIKRILDDLERQIEQLARESAVNLFGSMLQDLERFGADSKLQDEVRRNMAILEHILKMQHYRTEIEILRAQGKLSEEVLKTLDDAFKFLEGVDPTKFLGGGPGANGPTASGAIWLAKQEAAAKAAEELAKKVADATKALLDMEHDALDPLTRDLLDLNNKFIAIIEVLGETEQVMRLFAEQTEKIMRKHFGAILDLIDSLDTDEMDPSKTIDKLKAAQNNFDEAIAAVAAGDYSKLQDIPNLFESMIALASQVNPLGSEAYREFFNSAKQDLLDLVAGVGFDVEDLGSLDNLNNLLQFPNIFNETPAPINLQQGTFDPVVTAIGSHSDRQHIQLQEANDRLASIEEETRRTRRAVGEILALKII